MKSGYLIRLMCSSVLVFGPGLGKAASAQDAGPQGAKEQHLATDGDSKASPGSDHAVSKTTTNGENANSARMPADYRIGVDDELNIAVWHEPELSQIVVVRPDGMITLPLLNDIQIAGLTPEEMQALLTDKLRTVVNDPQVTVSVKTIKSRKAFIAGNIAKQGAYPLTGRTTVLELIVEAGGLTPFAKGRAIYVLRKQGGQEVRLPFNYKKALSGKGSNPELLPGDIVVVP